MNNQPSLRIGWASADITPERPAVLGGMPWARATTGVMDPLTATALALDTTDPETNVSESVIFVGCDLRGMRDELRDAVRAHLAGMLPELDPTCVVLNATHTHNAPPLGAFGIELDGMS